MKFVTAALMIASSLPLFAHAKANSLQVDLDGDGKPDRVSLRRMANGKETLEVQLSATGQTRSFPHIPALFGQGTCDVNMDVILSADGQRAFRLTAQRPQANDECTYELGDASIVMANGELRIARVKYDHWYGHANGYEVSSDGSFEADMLKSQLKVTGNSDKTTTEGLASGCQVSLKSLDEQKILPTCLTVPALFLYKELSRGDDALPVCPALEGIYECHNTKYPKDAPSSVSIVSRELNHQLNLDFSIANATAVIDGISHRVDQNATGDEYLVSSCRRNVLQIKQASWFHLEEGDPRKKWTDLKPWMLNDFMLTQTDLKGKKFTYHHVCQVQDINGKNDGSYDQTCDEIYECTSVKNEE